MLKFVLSFILILVPFSTFANPQWGGANSNTPPFNYININTAGGTSYSIRSLNSLYTTAVWATGASAAKTLTLKGCSATDKGAIIEVKDGDNNANTYPITITPTSGTINATSSATLSENGVSQLYVCDGVSNWVASGSAAGRMATSASNATLPTAKNNIFYTPPVCDGVYKTDGAITSGTTTFTSASASFVSTDVGKLITIAEAGSTQHFTSATISAGGSTYLPGETYTLSGGTSTTAAVVKILATNAGAITEAVVYTPGTYSVVPSNPVSLGSGSGSGTGGTLTVSWDRDNLVTTISSFSNSTTVILAGVAGATVSSKQWAYGSDYATTINDALARGVDLPKGYCGIGSTINITSNSRMIGQGSGQNTATRTELLWLGSVGGKMVSTDNGASVTGLELGNFDINGVCSAARGIEIHNVVNSTFLPLRASRSTAVQIHVDSVVSPVQYNTFYRWTANAGNCGSANDQGLVWGPGTASTDISQTYWYNLRVTSVNGTAFECGSSDANRFYGFWAQRTGTGKLIDMLGGAATNRTCRSNIFAAPETSAGSVVLRGTNEGYVAPSIKNVFSYLITESATPSRTYGTGALLFCTNQRGGSSCGNVAVRATSLPANPTGTTATTAAPVMAGLAITFTPRVSGHMILAASGHLRNTTAGNGSTAQIYYGTGTPPANGDASTGSACSQRVTLTASPNNNDAFPFSLVCTVDLTVDTTYWMDLRMATPNAGTASTDGLTITYEEQTP